VNPFQAATQARIERITSALEQELGLDGWLIITHVFDTGYDGDTALDDDGSSHIYATTAITTSLWRYRCAKVRWFLATAASQTDDELTLVAIHEYLHILISPVTSPVPHKSVAADLEEYAVESITRVIARARGMTNVH
jgi:hypothetical protein